MHANLCVLYGLLWTSISCSLPISVKEIRQKVDYGSVDQETNHGRLKNCCKQKKCQINCMSFQRTGVVSQSQKHCEDLA